MSVHPGQSRRRRTRARAGSVERPPKDDRQSSASALELAPAFHEGDNAIAPLIITPVDTAHAPIPLGVGISHKCPLLELHASSWSET